MDGGLRSEDSLFVCKKLADMGINAIEISGGTAASRPNEHGERINIDSKEKQSYFREYAARVSREVNIPVILVGGNRNVEVMNEILNDTEIEYFSLARPFICEPDLVNRWSSGDTEDAKCISCNMCSYGICVLNNISKS